MIPKNHVTQKSNGCLKFRFAIIGINYILKYIQIENRYYNISQYDYL